MDDHTDQSLKEFARQAIAAEAAAVARMADAVDEHFVKAVRAVLDCKASVLCSGVGKAGHVARKIAATLASTGTPSHFLSAADAGHGDLGALRPGDIVLIFSSSGESDEILRMLNLIKKLGNTTVAVTATRTSSLGRFADIVLATGNIDEACPLGLAPSASTTAMLALADALALTVMRARHFTADDFARFHPAGQLGRKLIRVREAMTFRRGENLPVASDRLTVGGVLHEVSSIKRRSGAVILIDGQGRVSGLFSDGDLRRLVTSDEAAALSKPISQVMTRHPKSIRADALASEAMAILHEGRFDELPVVDDDGRPVGLIDVQDLVVLKMLDVAPDGG